MTTGDYRQAVAPGAVAAVVGCGAMGRGIGQLLAQAGLEVRLYDAQAGAADAARAAIAGDLDKLVTRGKLAASDASAATARLLAVGALSRLAGATLVVEAVIEDLETKRRLFAELESIVGEQAILATNTSSLSIAAIAAACRRPERVAGFHFFNPAPVMKVVEVIAALRTDASVCDALASLSERFGHAPVRAADTPGFIVNHAGRGYVTEGLRDPRRRNMRPGGTRRRAAGRLRFQARPLRAARSHRPRRLPPCDGVDLSSVLRRAALPPAGGDATDAGCRAARPEARCRLLPLRRRPADASAWTRSTVHSRAARLDRSRRSGAGRPRRACVGTGGRASTTHPDPPPIA